MHYVWSMVGSLALYVAHTSGSEFCNCSNKNVSYHPTFPDDGTITVPGLESDFSLAIIFTRLIEFNATKKNMGAEALDLPTACNETAFLLNDSYNELVFNDSMTWEFIAENSTFVGSLFSNNTVFENRTRFSIKVSNEGKSLGHSRHGVLTCMIYLLDQFSNICKHFRKTEIFSQDTVHRKLHCI